MPPKRLNGVNICVNKTMLKNGSEKGEENSEHKSLCNATTCESSVKVIKHQGFVRWLCERGYPSQTINTLVKIHAQINELVCKTHAGK